MKVKFREINLKGWYPWLLWYYAHKDGSPVLIEEAKWWKHGVVIGRKYEIIFRHHEKTWDWLTGRYEA